MTSNADPMFALRDLQQAMDKGIPLGLRDLDDEYKARYDEFENGRRFLFAKIVNKEVQALSIFGIVDPIDGIECWAVGIAVSERYRKLGFAAEAVNKGVEELKKIFKQTTLPQFYIEAVIDESNHPSIKLAEKLFTIDRQKIIEGESEKPALWFKKLITIE